MLLPKSLGESGIVGVVGVVGVTGVAGSVGLSVVMLSNFC